MLSWVTCVRVSVRACVRKRVHISLRDKGLSSSALPLTEKVLVPVCLHALVFVCAGKLSPTSEIKTFPS